MGGGAIVVHASFNARAIGRALPARAAIELAAAAGFDGVDLLVRDLVDAGESPTELRGRMDDLGLRGGAWPLPVDWRGDEGRFRRDLALLPRLAWAAATLGLSRTGTWVLPETPRAPGTAAGRAAHLEEVVALHRGRLGAIARVLGDHGCRLGLEVIGVAASRTGRGLPFVHRLADLDAVLGGPWDEVPDLGIVLDTFHLYAAGEDPEETLAWSARRVVWVHAADLPAAADGDRRLIRDDRRGLPGENGAVAVGDILRRLADLGYEGPVTVEPWGLCRSLVGLDIEASARAVATALRAVWPRTVAGRLRSG
jgi:sugar phosphate isomerase/epimerase